MKKLKLSEVRAKFPMYADLSDDQLLIGVRRAFYPDIPMTKFTQNIDFDTQRVDPTEGMSTMDKVLAGAGKAVNDTWTGVRQITGNISKEEVDEQAALDKPLMDTGAGVLGNVAGQVAQIALPIGAAASIGAKVVPGAAALATKAGAAAPYMAAAAQNGVFSALQPVVGDESRLGNAAGGAALGAAGQGVASAATKVAQGASQTLSPNIRALYEKALEQGIPVRVDQLGDSRFLKTLASNLQRIPGTGAQSASEAQQQAFNRAVSRQMGEDAPGITPEIYSAAKRRLGATFEDLSGRNNLQINDDLLGELGRVVDEAERFASPDVARAVSNLADDFLRRVEGDNVVPGRAYQSMDSMMGKLMKSGGEKAHFVGQLRDTVRGGMDNSISEADQAAWGAARGQYKALKTVRDIVAKDPQAGNVAPAQLASRIASNNAGKESMASGTAGELGDLAMIGRQFVRDPIPDSGTASRLAAGAALPLFGAVGGAVTSLAGNSGEKKGIGDVLTDAALGAAIASGGGFAASKVLNSPAATSYLANGMPAPVQSVVRLAAKPAPMLLPAGVRALYDQ